MKANISACTVVVQGKLEGNIHASDRVNLKQSAIVVGDIATQRISIDEGAYLKGSVSIQKEAPNKEGWVGLLFPQVRLSQKKMTPCTLLVRDEFQCLVRTSHNFVSRIGIKRPG